MLGMAALLLWAGLEKARHPAFTTATIRSLGLPSKLARPAALFLTVAELAVAVALLFKPNSAVVQVSVVSLAGLFALAGLLALGLDEPIHCGCFGAGGRGYLGAAQLKALPLWLAGVLIIRWGMPEAPPLPTAAAYFAAASLGITAVQGIRVRKAQLEARGDRLSAQEMYAWLPSR